MKKISLGLIAAAAFCLLGAAPRMLAGFPTGPGKPGGGYWIVKIWQDRGCQECSVSREDENEFGRFVDFMAAKNVAPIANLPTVGVLRMKGALGLPETRDDLANIRSNLHDCKIGSSGILVPNDDPDRPSFGIRFDCQAVDHAQFMSVTLENHKIKYIYWLPDSPIAVAPSHG